MTDLIIKGTGNSRKLKSVSNFKTLYPTYDKFADAFVAGTLPVDILGLNSAGVQTAGTGFTKANILKDSTAALFGLPSSAVPDQVFANIGPKLKTAYDKAIVSGRIATGSYVGAAAGSGSKEISITVGFKPSFFILSNNETIIDSLTYFNVLYFGINNLISVIGTFRRYEAVGAGNVGSITNNGVTINSDGNTGFGANQANITYRWFAIG